ncbi:hypothetical protein SAMN04515647_4672 [Cohaesibacter sp. ES.047]|nr:hypothetical protein SAMN04515647_4672 [Cohaesibacter sp. ES.047]
MIGHMLSVLCAIAHTRCKQSSMEIRLLQLFSVNYKGSFVRRLCPSNPVNEFYRLHKMINRIDKRIIRIENQ